MTFAYQEYFSHIVGTPLIASILIVFALISLNVIFFTRKKIKKNKMLTTTNNTISKEIVNKMYSKKSMYTSWVGYIILSVILLACMILVLFKLPQAINLINEKEEDKIKIIGEINYMTSETFTTGYILVDIYIDNEKYHIARTGDLEVGDEVVFEYLPKSKVILAINKIE